MRKGVVKGVGVAISQPTKVIKVFVRGSRTFNIS